MLQTEWCGHLLIRDGHQDFVAKQSAVQNEWIIGTQFLVRSLNWARHSLSKMGTVDRMLKPRDQLNSRQKWLFRVLEKSLKFVFRYLSKMGAADRMLKSNNNVTSHNNNNNKKHIKKWLFKVLEILFTLKLMNPHYSFQDSKLTRKVKREIQLCHWSNIFAVSLMKYLCTLLKETRSCWCWVVAYMRSVLICVFTVHRIWLSWGDPVQVTGCLSLLMYPMQLKGC